MTLDHHQPSRQQLAAVDRSAPLKCTGKVKTAIDSMVWQGLRRDDAALAAGLTSHGLREALRKSHVKAYYNEQCEVLRLSGRARRIHRLEAMVEQDENKQAVINAVRALDHIDEAQQSAAGRTQMPGFVIVIGNPEHMPNAQMQQVRGIESKPLISQDLDSHEATALPNVGNAKP